MAKNIILKQADKNNFKTPMGHVFKSLFHECTLDMRWERANEADSAELPIAISYPTNAIGIFVLSKTNI